MNLNEHITPRVAGASAIVASAALAVQGILQLTDEQSSESTSVGIEHVGLAGFSLALFALIPVVLHLGRLAGRPRSAGLASIGLAALGVLGTISNVRGSDPSFFAAVAAPSNLAWLVGFVLVAAGLLRSRRVPAVVAIGLPLTWLLSIPLAPLGGTLLAGGYWLAVGWMLRNDVLAQRGSLVVAA